MNPAKDSYGAEQSGRYPSQNMNVRRGCFGKLYCPVAAELDNQTFLLEQAQRAADSVIESEKTSDLVESVQEVCDIRGGAPRQIAEFALQKNLGQESPRMTEEQALNMIGMQIVDNPGFGYGEQNKYEA